MLILFVPFGRLSAIQEEPIPQALPWVQGTPIGATNGANAAQADDPPSTPTGHGNHRVTN